ncbi:MAG: rhodanese-like domain-containing protein [Chloroflexi bacterium]|nr:rhodanese-like domain-containing protein [Chloroflexota bacterium]
MSKQKKQQGSIWLWGGVLLALGLGAALLLGALNPNPSAVVDAAAGELPLEVSVAQAADLREQGVLMLDVREPDEWREVHIPGATLIPLGELAGRVDELPKDQPIVVVCRSGNRSAVGRDILLEAGFEQVTSMAGGMNDWKAAGYETASGD